MNAIDIARDRWGRPLIVPPEGGKPIGYTRISTMAKALSDGQGLAKWQQRQTAIGISKRPDLQALVSANPDDKRAVAGAVAQAMSAAGSDEAANAGTAFHGMSELVDSGADLSGIPPAYLPPLRAYRETMQANGVQVLAMERFVVVDDLQAAGTFDRLVAVDGELMIADIKTGADAPRYSLETAVQVALYSRGALYDPEAKTRQPIPGVSTSKGLLIHVPKGEAVCSLHTLDLQAGWLAACLAFDVRQTRKLKLASPFGAV